MSNSYLDANALVKRYVEEPGSQMVRNLLKKEKQLFFTCKTAYAEVLMTFRRKKEEGLFSDEDFYKCIDRFEQDWQALNIIELSDEILRVLKGKVLKYSLRAIDALHLSSALWLKESIGETNIVFICSDRRLKEKAELEGFSILDPAE